MGIVIDLSGKLALVTGASQGLGEQIARTLHRAGARVILNHPGSADGKTEADAQAIVAELNRDRPGDAHVVTADVSDPEAVREMMEAVKSQFSGLDILVNNAGILRDRSVAK